jgi:muramoyltetrapeptide carboxypeptidase
MRLLKTGAEYRIECRHRACAAGAIAVWQTPAMSRKRPAAPSPAATVPAPAGAAAIVSPAAPLPLYLISPSSAVPADAPLARSLENMRAAGFAPVLDPGALRTHQRFAGTDAQRLAAFARAAAQPAQAVMITRGGYGLTRLLPGLDFSALAAAGKQWIGYSDFTAFQLAMLAQAGAITWSGPALLDDFATEPGVPPDDITVDTLHDALAGRLEMLGFRAGGAPAGLDVRGTLWGGNLTVLCSLLGTPWFPAVQGGILYLEDVGEHPYRIERMLGQLLQAGVIDAQSAVLIGYVNRYKLVERDAGFDMPVVVRRLRSLTRTPVITGLPVGHDSPKLTLPHGARVGLATEGRTAYLVLHEH